MTVVLDAGALTALASDPAALSRLAARERLPALVPSAVLVESLTGDHRRDHATNRLLRACVVEPVDEALARDAASLRTATGRAATISAVGALVVALAQACEEPLVITGDLDDIRALAERSAASIRVLAAR